MHLEARLRAFAAFVRRRSFSAAAAELRISQPAVSKHVADLERMLGLALAQIANDIPEADTERLYISPVASRVDPDQPFTVIRL